MVATNRITLVQETSDQYGFLVFRPVYRGGAHPLVAAARNSEAAAEVRNHELIGFTLAVFRVGDMVEKAGAAPSIASGVNLAIFDLDAHRGERLLYPKRAHFDGIDDLPSGYMVYRKISVAGRTWGVAAYPLPNSFRPSRWGSWSTLVAGLLLTCLVIAHLGERRRSEAALRQSEERARLLFATIPHAALVIDIATQDFLEINDAAERQYVLRLPPFLSCFLDLLRRGRDKSVADRAAAAARPVEANQLAIVVDPIQQRLAHTIRVVDRSEGGGADVVNESMEVVRRIGPEAHHRTFVVQARGRQRSQRSAAVAFCNCPCC